MLINFSQFLENESNIDLWLDDERDPKDPFIIQNFGSKENMLWVKSVPEAIKFLKTGRVTSISFDNDLGLPQEGKDLARWIEEKSFNKEIPRLNWKIHSMNGPASKEIHRAMQNADRFWNQ